MNTLPQRTTGSYRDIRITSKSKVFSICFLASVTFLWGCAHNNKLAQIDPAASRELVELNHDHSLASNQSTTREISRYEQVAGVTIPKVQPSDIIGFFRQGGGSSLLLSESGRFTYETCSFCMYSYSGFEGDWELEGNVIKLQHAKPTKAHRSIHGTGSAPAEQPFLQIEVVSLNGRLMLVDSRYGDKFINEGEGCAFVRAEPPDDVPSESIWERFLAFSGF